MKARLTGRRRRSAGGVAVDASGNVYQALAAGGSVDGQPYAGDKDLVLVKDSPAGTRLWTASSARPARAGLRSRSTRPGRRRHRVHERRLDGNHAANTTDDVFVVKFDPTGPSGGSGSSASRRGRPRLRDRHRRGLERLRHRLHPRQPRGRQPGRQGRLRRQARPDGVGSGQRSSAAPARTRRGASPRPATGSGVGGMTRARSARPAERSTAGSPATTQPAAAPGCSSSAPPRTRRCGG